MRRVWVYRPSGDGGQTCGGCGHTGIRGTEAGHAAGVGIPEYGGRRPDMRRDVGIPPYGGDGGQTCGGCGYTGIRGTEAGHAAGVGIPPFGGWRPNMRRVWAYRSTECAWDGLGTAGGQRMKAFSRGRIRRSRNRQAISIAGKR